MTTIADVNKLEAELREYLGPAFGEFCGIVGKSFQSDSRFENLREYWTPARRATQRRLMSEAMRRVS